MSSLAPCPPLVAPGGRLAPSGSRGSSSFLGGQRTAHDPGGTAHSDGLGDSPGLLPLSPSEPSKFCPVSLERCSHLKSSSQPLVHSCQGHPWWWEHHPAAAAAWWKPRVPGKQERPQFIWKFCIHVCEVMTPLTLSHGHCGFQGLPLPGLMTFPHFTF